VELVLEQDDLEAEKKKLLESLIAAVAKTRRVKRQDLPSKVLFEIYNMNQNNMSKVLSESAMWLTPSHANSLLDQGYVQRIVSEGQEKYTLTFKGISDCVKYSYGQTLEEQFLKFLDYSDLKFASVEASPFKWDEKLAGISLILVGSTSASSAIRLNNDTNRAVFTEVFDRVFICLKKFGLVNVDEKLRKVSRGESPVMAVMSRLNTLARKTNHYYRSIPQESAYFFDIETEGTTDERKLSFLFRKMFQSSPEANFDEMFKELADISRVYSPRFLARSTNQTNELLIVRKMKDFFDSDIHSITIATVEKAAGRMPES